MQMLSTSAGPGPRKHVVLAEHWRRFAETRDRQTRDHLILAHAPIVKYVAGRVAAKMPQHVELADLVSYGLSGLIDAVEKFDPGRGIAFESYASQRIRGAIYDELRTLDWVPRAVRAEARALTDATGKLVTLLQRAPTDGEVAAELGLGAPEYDASVQRVADSHLVALDKQWNTSGDGDAAELALVDTLADDHAIDPAASAGAVDLRERIATAIEQLPDRQQLILGLRYHQELSLGEIGRVLDISESRVCQLHAKAVVLLRALLEDETDVAD